MEGLDIRFGSREKMILGQIEVGSAVVPGSGGCVLPLLVGRSRALKIIVGSEDYDADTAERYGRINRAIPDAELDDFVDRFARRVSSFFSCRCYNSRSLKIWWRDTHAKIHPLATTQCSYYVRTICEVGDDKFGSHFAQRFRSFVEAVFKRSDLKIALSKKFDDTSPYGTNISCGSSNNVMGVLFDMAT